MASLFARNRVKEAAGTLSTAELATEIDLVRKWHADLHYGTLLEDNETAREQQFNQDFFVTILGYRMKPSSAYTIEPKSSTSTGHIPDARLGRFDASLGLDDTSAVVELKGASISLDKPQKRHGNLSPVGQGFMYRPLYRGSSFVIVSNFVETRLYHDNQLDFEAWTLNDLVNPADDFLAFKTFYLLLHAERLLRHDGISATEQMLSDIRTTQEKIGKQFYEDYRQVRASLLQDLFTSNQRVRSDLNFGIEKAQKIIDRIVFACFAEDRGLLPDDTLHRILLRSESSPYSAWTDLKAFFGAIDKGDSRLQIPVGYNGGLFASDADLDSLAISDDVVRKLLTLGARYDFVQDLSVTILGHIFEQSITDLEQIRHRVGSAETVTLEMLSAGRRRNDGIYYTPEYIVRHMVDQSVGAYLRAEERRLAEENGLRDGILDSTYAKREQDTYNKYREQVLLKVRIVDAACGSGAFLTAAFDLLMAEHRRVSTILGNDIYGNAALTGWVLRSNLYGVDINEESVEITKLSLWLKSAIKNTKLEGLDKNIRVGNSLLNASKRAGDKAFDWRAEFPEVFPDDAPEEQGFHAVVMNPPYIKEFTNREAFDGLRDLDVYQGKMDLWYAFGDLALDLAQAEHGRIAFIAPSNWLTNAGASKFRNRVLNDGKILQYWDFGDTFVFDDASIQTMVYIMQRTASNDEYSFPYRRISKRVSAAEVQRFLAGVEDESFTRYVTKLAKIESLGKVLSFNDEAVGVTLERIASRGTTHLLASEAGTGIDVHQDYLSARGTQSLEGKKVLGSGIFNLSISEYNALQLNSAERSLVRPFFTSEQLGRYFGDARHRAWVIYTDSTYKDPNSMLSLPHLREHLDSFQPVITSDNAPYGLHRSRDPRLFSGTKIMSIRKTARPTFTYTDFPCYVSQTYNVIKTDRFDMAGLTALLNSRMIAFWLRYKGKMQGNLYQVDKDPLRQIPLIEKMDLSALTQLAHLNIAARKELFQLNSDLRALLDGISPGWVESHPSWWSIETSQLLESVGVEVSLQHHTQLIRAFDTYRETAIPIVDRILGYEREVDEVVHRVYGLTSEQVLLIERHIPSAAVELA